MQGAELDAGDLPTQILGQSGFGRERIVRRAALALDRQGSPTQRPVDHEGVFANPAQPAARAEWIGPGPGRLERIAIGQPAVGPLVVAGHEHEGRVAGLEHRQPVLVERVVAALATALDVTVVHHHPQPFGVHLGQHLGQVLTLETVVRNVAEHTEAERLCCLQRGRQQGGESEEGAAQHHADSRLSS